MDLNVFDLYVDYLICSTSYTTATGLSKLTNKVISHDRITRCLSERDFTAKDFWQTVKSSYKSIEGENGVFIVDDSIQEKPYTDENELICWHYDHSKKRSVKGINFVSGMYYSEKGALPIGYELVRKNKIVIDNKTGKRKPKATISKQEHFRSLIAYSLKNEVKYDYVLTDSWFASKENMIFIKKLGKDFIMSLKTNRKVALSEEDKSLGKFVGIDSLELGEGTIVWLKDLEFPLRLVRQIFKDGDGSTGVLYLASSTIGLTDEQIATIYQKRWKIETYHKSLKNNASLAKSPAKTIRTQANHLFASLCAYIRIDLIARNNGENHFSLKSKIYLASLRNAMLELKKFCTQDFSICNFTEFAA
jgi:hypothetical protein